MLDFPIVFLLLLQFLGLYWDIGYSSLHVRYVPFSKCTRSKVLTLLTYTFPQHFIQYLEIFKVDWVRLHAACNS